MTEEERSAFHSKKLDNKTKDVYDKNEENEDEVDEENEKEEEDNEEASYDDDQLENNDDSDSEADNNKESDDNNDKGETLKDATEDEDVNDDNKENDDNSTGERYFDRINAFSLDDFEENIISKGNDEEEILNERSIMDRLSKGMKDDLDEAIDYDDGDDANLYSFQKRTEAILPEKRKKNPSPFKGDKIAKIDKEIMEVMKESKRLKIQLRESEEKETKLATQVRDDRKSDNNKRRDR